MTAMIDEVLAYPLVVDTQNALSESEFPAAEQPPTAQQLSEWANSAYACVADKSSEVTIRLVDESEITQLNRDYRYKDKPTNVLSFPFQTEFDDALTDQADFNLLGDIVICHSVIVQEASQQSKSVIDHYAHMVVHGILHLCGYDHHDDVNAEKMEALETQVLAQQQIANPYL